MIMNRSLHTILISNTVCMEVGLAYCTQSTGVIPNTLFTEITYNYVAAQFEPLTGLENVPSDINRSACFKTGLGQG